MFKVVVSDLDGTLLNNQHQISPHTRRTLHRLTAEGIRFIVATGRHHIDVQGIRNALGLEIFLITANGVPPVLAMRSASDRTSRNAAGAAGSAWARMASTAPFRMLRPS